jgi:DHA1 family tetracycline resistance protein-like MFS transporter
LVHLLLQLMEMRLHPTELFPLSAALRCSPLTQLLRHNAQRLRALSHFFHQLPLAVYRRGGAASVGWVVAAGNLGGLTAPLWGALADRYRLHRGLAVGGSMVAAMGLALFPLTTSLAVWLGLALLQGMGAVGATTVANLFVVEAHPQEEWEAGIGWLQTCYGGGQVCGLCGAAAFTQAQLPTGLLAAAGLTALAALTAWFTTRTPAHPLTQKPALLQPPRPSEWPVSSPQHLFHHLTRSALQPAWRDLCPPFALFLTAWFLCFAGSWAFFGHSPVLMQQLYGVSPWPSSFGSAVAHGLGLTLCVPAGLWSERRGPERVLKRALSMRELAFISLGGLGFLPVAGRDWLALLCVIVVILSWSLFSVSGTALTARFSRVGEGEGMGLFNATTAVAGVMGAALGGWVADRWGYHLALGLLVVGVALGWLLALMFRPVPWSHLDPVPGECASFSPGRRGG